MDNKRSRTFVLAGGALLCFVLGIAFSLFFIQSDSSDSGTDTTFSEKHLSGFKYISPLLECNNNQEIGISKYNKLKDKINNFVDDSINQNSSLVVSVYFRDLNNGPWFGIHPNENFSPASLMKVPLLIAYLKESENNPDLLGTELSITLAPTAVEQTIQPQQLLDPNKKYPVKDLLYRMIAFSDNEATASLFAHMPAGGIERTYQELGLDIPSPTGHQDSVTSVKEYASFFRILYNSSYLSKWSSEQALSLLTKSIFTNGLVAGVDKGTPVAHKFGEREIANENLYQLHDCGIVYYPHTPYLLCVMTRSNTKNELPGIISGISRIVYDTISTQK